MSTPPPVPTKQLPDGLTWIKAFSHFDGKPGSWLPYIEQFESVCSLLGLWWLITLTDEEAADFDQQTGSREDTDKAKYKEFNEALYCALHITVDANTAALLRGPKLKKNGRAAFFHLRNHFQSSSASRASHLLTNLLNMTWSGQETATTALTRVIATRDELARINSPVPDGLLVTLVQRMLPDRYAPLRAWLIGTTPQTIETILTKATEIDLANAAFGSTMYEANTTTEHEHLPPLHGSTDSSKPRQRRTVACYYCARSLDPQAKHVWRTCPDRLADVKQGIWRVNKSASPSTEALVLAEIKKRYGSRVADENRYRNRKFGSAETFRAQFVTADDERSFAVDINHHVASTSSPSEADALDPFDLSYGFHSLSVDHLFTSEHLTVPGHPFSLLVDSGCTRSITPSTHQLERFESVPPGKFKVRVANKAILDVTHVGVMHITVTCTNGSTADLAFTNMFVCPGATTTLLSAKAMAKELHCTVTTGAEGSCLTLQDGRTISLHEHHGLDFLTPTSIATCLTVTPTDNTSIDIRDKYSNFALDFDNADPLPINHEAPVPQPLSLLHQRLCHLAMPRLVKFADVLGCPLSDRQANDCVTCLQGKMSRSRANKHPTPEARTRKPFELIYYDASGKITPTSHLGYQYIVAFRDDFSSYVWLRYARSKHDFIRILDRFLSTHPDVQRLRMDRDPMNTAFHVSALLASHAVTPEYRDTGKPEQLGFLENIWRWITRATISILINANMPRDHWDWGTRFVIGTTNIVPSSRKNDKSAHAMLFGTQPSAAPIRTFGSTALAWLDPIDRHGKFDDHAVKTIYLGYDVTSGGSIVYDFNTRRERITNECKILEDQLFYPPVSKSDTQKIAIPPTGIDLTALAFHTNVDVTDASIEDTVFKAIVHGPNNPTWRQALKSPQSDRDGWLAADASELNSLAQNAVLGPALQHYEIPLDTTIIPVRRVLKIKSDGRKKVRYCADGRALVPGIDFEEHGAYSPVARFQCLRMFLSLAAANKLHIRCMDAETAYQQAELPGKPVFVRMPSRGGEDTTAGTIHRLQKALYGLQVAGRVWYTKLSSWLLNYGFRRLAADSCVFVMGSELKRILLCLYVDDVWVAYADSNAFTPVDTAIRRDFKFGPIEPLQHSLGISITSSRDRGTITIDQNEYVRSIIERWGLSESPGQSVPIPLGSDLTPCSDADHEEAKHLNYRELVGCLNYACLTVIEIQFAVNALSRFFHRWGKRPYQLALGVVRYLKSRPDQRITYRHDHPQVNELIGWSDADFAGDKATMKSTGAYFIYLNGGPVASKVFTMKTIARSTADAESAALAACVTDMLFCREFLREIGTYNGKSGFDYDSNEYNPDGMSLVQRPPSVIKCDNSATIKLAKRRTTTDQSKHLCVRQAFLHQVSETNKHVRYEHVASTKNLADLGTKLLGRVMFTRIREAVYGDQDVVINDGRDNTSNMHCVTKDAGDETSERRLSNRCRTTEL